MAKCADDATLGNPSPGLVQSAINKAGRWSEGWSLPINVDKFVTIIHGRSDQHRFTINKAATLTSADRRNLSGIWLDSNLHSSH